MDDILRKLDEIDQKLAGKNLTERLASTAPLFLPAGGMILGILIQDSLARNPADLHWAILPWLLPALAMTAGAVVFHARTRLRPEALALIASVCFVCLGAIRLLAFETAPSTDIRHRVGSQRVLATVRGRILTRPYRQVQNWTFARFAFTDSPTTFYLKIEAVQGPARWHDATGTIRVRVDEPVLDLDIGDRIEVFCWLHGYEEPTNPGQFNVAKHLRLRNVHVGASVPARDAITVVGRSWGILSGLRKRLTDAATSGLLDHPPSDTPGEALLEALLLGQRRNIDPDTYEAFRRTGLLHLISLSGMHLGILILIVWRLGKFAGLMKGGRAVVCIVATAVVLLVVPPRAPTLRAAVIVWTLCASLLLRRRTNPLNSLSLAAIILLLIRPTQIFDVGWQLSFGATAGILAFTGKIENWLRDKTLGPLESEGRSNAAIHVLKTLAQGTIRVLSVGMAAWLGSAGILLYHFYTITPLVSVWTPIAAIPVTAILAIGFLKIVLSFLLPTVSLFLGHVLSVLADLLLELVGLMARLDFSHILIGRVPLVLIALYYASILFVAYFSMRRPLVKRVLCAVMLLALIVPLGVLKWQRTYRNHLSITCLDVGHGQAILARLPGTMNILFDAGSLYGSDVGTRIIVPFLDHEGISRLHAVVVSHGDIDHINGLPEVVNRRTVDRVYFDDTTLARSKDVETVRVLMDHLRDRRIRAERMPESLDAGPAQIRVLWPTGDPAAWEPFSDNDRSLVCLIEYAGRRVLFCSDIEKPAQQEILKLYPALKADVVIVPHHGSKRTLEEGFLATLDASILLVSCGRGDYMRGRVIGSVEGGAFRLTGRDGALTACIDRFGMVEESCAQSFR